MSKRLGLRSRMRIGVQMALATIRADVHRFRRMLKSEENSL